MEESFLTEEMIEALRPIVEMNNQQFREVSVMLAGFMSLQERDIRYMDTYLDRLFDFMDPQSDTEMVMRQYYDYIATFDPMEAKERVESLENDMGYKTRIIFAAGLLAKKLHRGQTDKGGNDYFESHLLKVSSHGHDWKERVVGFLHDACEDCGVSVEEVMQQLDAEIARVTADSQGCGEEEEWWEDWMDDVLPFACDATHPITEEERADLITALNLLNARTAATREEYIERIGTNFLALKVKLNDLSNNMDITRIAEPTAKDYARLERYKREYQRLLFALDAHRRAFKG